MGKITTYKKKASFHFYLPWMTFMNSSLLKSQLWSGNQCYQLFGFKNFAFGNTALWHYWQSSDKTFFSFASSHIHMKQWKNTFITVAIQFVIYKLDAQKVRWVCLHFQQQQSSSFYFLQFAVCKSFSNTNLIESKQEMSILSITIFNHDKKYNAC